MQHLRAFDTGEVFDYQRALEVLGSKEKVLGAAQLSHRLWPDCLNGIRVALKRGRLDRAADEALALERLDASAYSAATRARSTNSAFAATLVDTRATAIAAAFA